MNSKEKATATSQAHLQGTQSQLCKRGCLVPTLPGHTLSNRTQYTGGHTLKKGERTIINLASVPGGQLVNSPIAQTHVGCKMPIEVRFS